jgi:uncharacterized membrane protein
MPAKEEIKAGIQNAINRGDSLQKAMQSFVNAGYNIEEVKKAAQEVNMGITQHVAPEHPVAEKEKKPNFFKKLFKKKKAEPVAPNTTEPPKPSKETKQEIAKPQHPDLVKKPVPWKIIGLSAGLVFLIIALVIVWIKVL